MFKAKRFSPWKLRENLDHLRCTKRLGDLKNMGWIHQCLLHSCQMLSWFPFFTFALPEARKMLHEGIELGVATDRFFADRAASLHWRSHVDSCCAFKLGQRDMVPSCGPFSCYTSSYRCFWLVIRRWKQDMANTQACTGDQQHLLSETWTKSEVAQCQGRHRVVMVWFADVSTSCKHTGTLSGGTIGALSYGVVDRVEFYAQPACLSLVSWQQIIMVTVSGLWKQHSMTLCLHILQACRYLSWTLMPMASAKEILCTEGQRDKWLKKLGWYGSDICSWPFQLRMLIGQSIAPSFLMSPRSMLGMCWDSQLFPEHAGRGMAKRFVLSLWNWNTFYW